MTTIAGIAAGNPNFSILVAAIEFIDAQKGTNYLGVLSGEVGDPSATYTVFAPTNTAFGQLAGDLGFDGDVADVGAVAGFLTSLNEDPVENATLLETVVTYHVAAGTLDATAISSAGTVATLQGGAIDATELPTLGDLEPDLLDPSLIQTDIQADNGIVHVVDRVLLPIDLPGNDAPTITQTVLNISGASGFDDNSNDFDLLRESLTAADLTGVLDDPNADLTAFAPTDGAFVALSQSLGYGDNDEAGAFSYLVDALRLLNGGNDPIELLTTVLTYHVAGQSLQASQVVTADEITTLQGGTIGVDAENLKLIDADPDIADPGLVATDIQAANGIIHVLDGVLLPADLLPSNGAGDVDFIIGDDGRDRIGTGRDNDLVDAKGGNDVVWAGNGADLVLAGGGNDRVFGGNGRDTVKGESGNDVLFGGRGKDYISGGSGHDKLFGGQGSDTISGGDGHDRLFGGHGSDVIAGGSGNDVLFGGGGADYFVFGHGDGTDTVFGFRAGQDKIDLSAFGIIDFHEVEGAISQQFFRTEIDLGDTEILLMGVRASHLDEGDFIL